MTKREMLREQFEDALFALLMDDLAVSEGQKALQENERLKGDPAFVVAHESQRRCEQTIARYFAKQTAYSVGRGFSRIVSKAVVVAFVAMLLFTTAFAVSPTFRASTLNLVVETFYDRTNLRFTDKTITESNDVENGVGWLPDGYSLSSQSADSKGSWSIYSSDNGGEIIIEMYKSKDGMLSLDTEDAMVQYVDIQANEAMMIIEGDSIQIVWADEEQGSFVSLMGSGVPETDLIKVAENIIVK